MSELGKSHRHGYRLTLALLAVALAVTLALSGCQLPFAPQVRVSGTVYGEQIAARLAGKSVPIPLRATITCNNTSTTADSKGAYSFSVPQASYYTCSATAPQYSRVSANLGGDANAFTLTFGPKLVDSCDHGATANVLTCGVIPPATAILRGTVTNAANDQALTYVEVQCWDSATDVLSDKPVLFTVNTDDLGNYVLRNLPAGPYSCVANADQTVQMTTLAPGKTTTLDLPACEQHCTPFRYHTGDVVNRLTAYLVFWLPSGYTFEPNGSSSRYEQLMEQYFQDVGGTSFYNILTQYYDALGGPIQNSVTLGGVVCGYAPVSPGGHGEPPAHGYRYQG